MTTLDKAKLHDLAITLLVSRSQLDDNERISIAEYHPAWQQKAYGSSEYVRYGIVPATGRAQLWMSMRSVPATAPAPDQPASPANWKKM